MPSRTLDSGRYLLVASSARSPTLSSTGVVCVWNPVIVLGRPACHAKPLQIRTCAKTSAYQRSGTPVHPNEP